MIRAGPSPPLSMARGPAGRHWTVHGSSLPRFPRRRLYNSSAHGWISEGFNPAAMFARWPGPAFSIHRPERSGLPSAVRGAGAVRFGLPSAVRGMPGVGRLSHCAATGLLIARSTSAVLNSAIPNSAPRFEPGNSLVYVGKHPQRCIVIAFYDPAQFRDHVHDFTLVCFSFRSQCFFDVTQTGMDIAQTG